MSCKGLRDLSCVLRVRLAEQHVVGTVRRGFDVVLFGVARLAPGARNPPGWGHHW
jgi:hypothetical protein